MVNLKSIHVFPVKSFRGFSPPQAEVSALGLVGDRQMMLVDDAGLFLSQRKHPKMALLHPSVNGNTLTVRAPNMPDLSVAVDAMNSPVQVNVWGDDCHGFVAAPSANRWFSAYMGVSTRLVRYDESRPRACDPGFSQAGDTVSFADGFPILAISQASLTDLNNRLDEPVSMDVFRPNLVLGGCDAYAEDEFVDLQIGEVTFAVVKPCARCVLTTVDPTTGVKRSDGEPLKTLSTYRKRGSGVVFGVNLIPRSTGTLCLEDEVRLL